MNQNRSVMQSRRAGLIEGVLTEGASAPAQGRHGADLPGNPGCGQGFADQVKLPPGVELALGQDQAEIQRAQILIAGSAAGQPPDDVSAGFQKGLYLALVPRILIPSHHDGVAVLGQEKNGRIFRQGVHQMFLDRQIAEHIVSTRNQAGGALYHFPCCLSLYCSLANNPGLYPGRTILAPAQYSTNER